MNQLKQGDRVAFWFACFITALTLKMFQSMLNSFFFNAMLFKESACKNSKINS
jgi:hypothetical protein